MKTYQPSDLVDFIHVEATIECSNCESFAIAEEEDEEYFFNLGWRATRDNVYCPDCVTKKLKNNERKNVKKIKKGSTGTKKS